MFSSMLIIVAGVICLSSMISNMAKAESTNDHFMSDVDFDSSGDDILDSSRPD